MTDIGNLNFLWSQTMIAGFSAAGVSHAVISPGSRSTPLALAMLRQAGLECTIAIDERSAAFFALGVAKASRCPVLLLATSGTAPANWLPAVIEASQSGIPLILISADRPPELQGCGANQTVDQINLFGSHVRASHLLGTPDAALDSEYLARLAARVVEQSTWPLPGPVHLNQPFREPLLPSGDIKSLAKPTHVVVIKAATPQPTALDLSGLAQSISGRPGFIVCGEQPKNGDFAEAVTTLAARLNCPIFAEPLSGLRFGPHQRNHLSVHYNRWLGDGLPAAAEWIIRFGAYPVTRHLQNLLRQSAPVHALIDPLPRWTDPAHKLSHIVRADPTAVCAALLKQVTAPCPEGWFESFKQREIGAAPAMDAWHIPLLLASAQENSAIFVGNSLAIRNLDSASGSGEKSLHFYANRGASGIDGNIATAAGLAAIHGSVIALLGDLSAQHDLGSLALTQGREMTIVVVNNGGGGIFDYLPQAQLPEFERGWRTPQVIDFKHAALSFGLAYQRCDTAETFSQALAESQQVSGPHLIELQIN